MSTRMRLAAWYSRLLRLYPRAFREEVTPDWARLCRAWDTWLVDLQSNAPRLLKKKNRSLFPVACSNNLE